MRTMREASQELGVTAATTRLHMVKLGIKPATIKAHAITGKRAVFGITPEDVEKIRLSIWGDAKEPK